MTDRELLEFAAKAAGMNAHEAMWHPRAGFVWVKRVDGIRTENAWNPLNDDGDALRLAVKLRIDVDHGEMNDAQGTPIVIAHYRYTLKSGQVCWNTRSEQYGDDQCAATRRAIVRAAAEIGRAMP